MHSTATETALPGQKKNGQNTTNTGHSAQTSYIMFTATLLLGSSDGKFL